MVNVFSNDFFWEIDFFVGVLNLEIEFWVKIEVNNVWYGDYFMWGVIKYG